MITLNHKSKTSCGFIVIAHSFFFLILSGRTSLNILLLLHQLTIWKCFIDQAQPLTCSRFFLLHHMKTAVKPTRVFLQSWRVYSKNIDFKGRTCCDSKCRIFITTPSVPGAFRLFSNAFICFVFFCFSVSGHCAVKDPRLQDQSMMSCALD